MCECQSYCLHQGLNEDCSYHHEDGYEGVLPLLDQPKQGNQYQESVKGKKIAPAQYVIGVEQR